MASNGRHDEAGSDLGRYWDELVQGRSANPADLDRALVATIRHLHARDDALGADPSFAKRLLEDLMHATTDRDPLVFHRTSPLTPVMDGRALSPPMPRLATPRSRWALTHLATAALLVLTLISGYVAFGGPLRSGRLGEHLATLPALIASDERPLAFVNEITGGADPLERPSGVAVASDGTLYVIDTARDHIRVFDANGNPIATWGESGTGPGQFGYSIDLTWGDLAFGPDGSIYVTDPNNSRIQKFTRDGTFVLEWGELGSEPGQFLLPSGIGIDGEGRVYVADEGNHQVHVFDEEGQLLTAWDGTKDDGVPFGGPSDVAIDAAGTVWVTDAILHQVVGFAPDGTPMHRFGKIGDDPGEVRGPWGIAIDAAGRLYVAEYDGDRVQVFAPDGASLGILGEEGAGAGQFSGPSFLTFAPDGSLYVTDEGNDRVQHFGALEN